MLARVVDRAIPLASQILLATTSGRRANELASDLPPGVRPLLDQPALWGNGPAAAMASARSQLGKVPILFLPGDIPWIETDALRRFVARASRGVADVAVPVWPGGATEHLLQWQRTNGVLGHLPRSRTHPTKRSWRASEFLRAVPRTLLISVATITDRPATFSHVTFPSDLRRPTARGPSGPQAADRVVEGVPKRHYAAAHGALARGDGERAARSFAQEGRWYSDATLPLLAQHAMDDSKECLQIRGRGSLSARQPPTTFDRFP